ncbi:MAG: hypothetical protein KDE15_15020 [Erythrobacter sp.]|nr:hypothetical protein [Erythrobacter sp.]
MPTDRAIVYVLAAAITLFAVIRGGSPERYCAAIIVAGILADRIYPLIAGERDFVHFASSRLIFDLMQFASFMAVALFANRIWPLWLSAAQLVAITGSLAFFAVVDGFNLAYWALTQLPLFVQLVALAIGTFAHHRRTVRIGRYNCWSPRAT